MRKCKAKLNRRLRLVVLSALVVMLAGEFPAFDLATYFFIKNAEAVIGRPASPGSVAGVRRRTRRRARRRAIYGSRVYALPPGCAGIMRAGVNYYHCGGVYYRPYYEGTTVVYVVVEAP